MTDTTFEKKAILTRNDDDQLLSFVEGETIANFRAYLQELSDNTIIDCRIFSEFFVESGFSLAAPARPGFITDAAAPGVDCCRQHPQGPTITSIRSRREGVDRQAVFVTASHPCGIREISIRLAAGVMKRSRSGRGLVRLPEARRDNNGRKIGDTWTRGDSTDATPQTAVSIFPNGGYQDSNNCYEVEVVSTCGTRVTAATTDYFDRPADGPF